EAHYPIDVKSTSDAGNAFVPRLFASLRIHDLERDGSDSARTEAVSLSQKLAVPSRFTSLLVLESETMFKAFGIDRNTTAPHWTGETVAESSEVTTSSGDAIDETVPGLLSNGFGASGGGGGGATGATAAPTATVNAQMGPPPAHKSAMPMDVAGGDREF